MTRTITRLFDSHEEALTAVRDLEAAGYDRNRVSLIANNMDDWHRGEGGLGDRDHDDDNDTAEGAGKGAGTGAVLGGGAGLLAGLGMLAIPGLGPIVAAGWLASTLTGALAGAAVGGVTGGLLGALKDAGHSDEEAHVYSEGVRRGGSLVSVRVDDDEAPQVETILSRSGATDAARRGAAYRQAGWTQFDPDAPAYTADAMAEERRRYREERSFAKREDYADDAIEADRGATLTPEQRVERNL